MELAAYELQDQRHVRHRYTRHLARLYLGGGAEMDVMRMRRNIGMMGGVVEAVEGVWAPLPVVRVPPTVIEANLKE